MISINLLLHSCQRCTMQIYYLRKQFSLDRISDVQNDITLFLIRRKLLYSIQNLYYTRLAFIVDSLRDFRARTVSYYKQHFCVSSSQRWNRAKWVRLHDKQFESIPFLSLHGALRCNQLLTQVFSQLQSQKFTHFNKH